MFFALLIILFSVFFTCLAWRNLLWATAFIIAFLPAYLMRLSLGPFPATFLEIMVLLLFAVWLVKQKEKIVPTFKNLKSAGWGWLIIAWLAFAAISVFISPDLRAGAGILKAYFIEPILFLAVLINVVKEKKDLELIFYALGFSALYISIFAIYQKFTGDAIPNPIWQAAETRRVTSFYGYPNAIGLYLAPIMVLYAGWLISKFQVSSFKFQVLFFQFLVIVTSAAAIIFARSEGAYAGVLVGLFFLGIMTKKLRLPAVVAAAIFIITIAAIPQLRHYATEQITFQNDSGKVRLIQWQETWNMLKDRSFSGAGLAGYQETFAPYHKAKHIEIYLYPHNLFLNFWSEVGLGGLIVFFLIVIKFFKDNVKKLLVIHSWLLVALSAAVAALLVHGLVDVPYFKNDLAILFWLLVGLSFIKQKDISDRIT